MFCIIFILKSPRVPIAVRGRWYIRRGLCDVDENLAQNGTRSIMLRELVKINFSPVSQSPPKVARARTTVARSVGIEGSLVGW